MKRTSHALIALGCVALTVAMLKVGMGASATSEAAPIAANSSAKAFAVDGVHTSVIFGIRHLDVANFYGRFNGVSGTIHWDDNAENIEISIEIDASSVDTNNRGRDDHLRSPDFFNVQEFPTITFNSTKVEHRSGDTYRVTGTLDLHGIERELSVDLKKTGSTTHPRTGKKVIGVETHFTIKRSDYRMNYGIEQNMLGDEVKLMIAVEGIEQ